jgi:RNase P/RNase MRP subunit POP5
MQKKIKSLLPSLKEKKRYLAYKITTKEKRINEKFTAPQIAESINLNLGAFESSEAGIMPIESNQLTMTGIIRISNKQMNKAKAALALITEIGSQQTIVRSITSSGMLNKARSAINITD